MKNKITLKVFFALIATFVFAGVAFGSVKASAGTAAAPVDVSKINDKVQWSYDAEADELILGFKNESDPDNPESVGLFYIAKNAENKENLGNTPSKWKPTKVFTAAALKSTTGNSINLAAKTKDGGLGAGATKYSTFAIAEAESSTVINYTGGYIQIQPAVAEVKSVVIDYAKAVTSGATGASGMVLYSVGYKVGSDGSQLTEFVDGSALGELKDKIGANEPFMNLEWAESDPSKGEVEWNDMDELNGAKLYELTHTSGNKGKFVSTKIYVRVKGKSFNTTASTNNTGIRPSKAKSITVKAAGKAVTVKLDVKNGNALKLKNGYDFAVVASGSAVTEEEYKWFTILPYKKDLGHASDSIKATSDFKAVSFPKTNSEGGYASGEVGDQYYTQTKVSSLPIWQIFQKGDFDWDHSDAVTIYYRKSAKGGAPASESSSIVLTKPLEVPGNDALPEDAFVVPTTGTSIKISFKTGYDCEMAVLKKDDANNTFAVSAAKGIDETKFGTVVMNAIDMTTLKWKAVKSGKDAVTPKTKTSSYKVYAAASNGADPSVSYVTGNAAKAREIDAGDYILIRFKGSAGKTGKNPQAPKLCSDIAVYKVVKVTPENKSTTPKTNAYVEIVPVYTGLAE